MIRVLHISTFMIIGFFLFGCSNQEARLKSIEKELFIKLPVNIEVIQDDDISHNGFESDYTQIVTLKFEKEEFEELIDQIESSPFFNELRRFDGKSKPFPNDKISKEHKIILDSLTAEARSGTWIKDKVNYKYIDFFTWSDFCDAYINTTNRTLKYTHNHL
ncbi:hypothetical protein IMCC3317_08840 [Kordia antarctica]|uniref:Lipoprotein n=1 Tax=Kordia antarctica TaxID=1218801 RepID=A0A7L4ZFP8_9FLAO|nr:hypothetical protein [Kordia antarctica]QHI35538.1 hypothetical protein IMCC3317_08840 [Kordia antarctica]